MKRSTRRITTNRLLLTLLLFLCLPSIAYANAGTPLMIGGFLYMFIGNALIGIFEGVLLWLLGRALVVKSILLMILANYVSAWGGACIIGCFVRQTPMTIENVQFWFWMFVLITFLLTLVIEFPFVLLVLRKTEHMLRKSLWITLVINAVSYIFIFGWYWMLSGTGMITDLDVVSAKEMQAPAGYDLYYISQDGKSVVKTDLSGKVSKKIKAINAPNGNDRLFVRPSQETVEQSYNLFLYHHHYEPENCKEELIVERFSPSSPLDRALSKNPDNAPERTWENFGPVPQLNTSGEWKYFAGFWEVAGIRGKNSQDGSQFHFSLETPFITWAVRNATHIEGDFVIFQLDRKQICILNPQTKKIALIAHGKGPVVAEAKEPKE